jgi:hypothetical protein
MRLLLSVVTLVTPGQEQTFIHSTQNLSKTALLCSARNWGSGLLRMRGLKRMLGAPLGDQWRRG